MKVKVKLTSYKPLKYSKHSIHTVLMTITFLLILTAKYASWKMLLWNAWLHYLTGHTSQMLKFIYLWEHREGKKSCNLRCFSGLNTHSCIWLGRNILQNYWLDYFNQSFTFGHSQEIPGFAELAHVCGIAMSIQRCIWDG